MLFSLFYVIPSVILCVFNLTEGLLADNNCCESDCNSTDIIRAMIRMGAPGEILRTEWVSKSYFIFTC